MVWETPSHPDGVVTMSRWERAPLPASLAEEPDGGLEEIPTVLMSRSSGSEVLFEDLRERYRRAMDTPELTSPSVRPDGALFDEVDGYELLDHPTGDIDPLNDYLELHALRTGVHSRIDDRSDPMANGISSWPQAPIPGLNRVDTPPPQEFLRAPDATLPEPSLEGIPLPPPTLAPQPAPAPVHHSVGQPGALPQGGQPHRTPSAERRGATPSSNQSIPIERAYRQVYGRTIRPNPDAEFGSTQGMLYHSASAESELELEPVPPPNPHRWDAWILAGFAISGIWALAIVRVLI